MKRLYGFVDDKTGPPGDTVLVRCCRFATLASPKLDSRHRSKLSSS